MVNICVTEDGSHTLFSEMAGQTYHSSHGAVQESSHIFISQLTVVSGQGSMVDGLQVVRDGSLTVLEIGFGTGLNALLSACWAKEYGVKVDYSTIELYPLEEKVYSELNYGDLLGCEEVFLKLHEAGWDARLQQVTPEFAICKCREDIVEWLDSQQSTVNDQQLGLYDVVFFDAFSPDAQPELWTEEVFVNVYRLMKKGGVLTTYCAKGDVRRAMLTAGFKVEKLQGPPGKRHILRAVK